MEIDRLFKKRADQFPNTSFLTMEGPEGVSKSRYCLHYELIEALKECLHEPKELLHDAIKLWMKTRANIEITDAQVPALVRFVADPHDLYISSRWRMEIIFRQDGTTDTDLGMVDIVHTDGSWRVQYNSRQADLAEAVRTAAVIAGTLPQRG
jgi:hypothetical protein